MKRAVLLAGTLAVILFVTTGGPWSRFVGHSHWALVEWVPFTRGVYPFDIVVNVALFVPLGLGLAWGRGPRARLAATIIGVLLSLSIELFQVYTHGRLATITDVLTNTCGAAIGATLATRRSTRATVQPRSSPQM